MPPRRRAGAKTKAAPAAETVEKGSDIAHEPPRLDDGGRIAQQAASLSGALISASMKLRASARGMLGLSDVEKVVDDTNEEGQEAAVAAMQQHGGRGGGGAAGTARGGSSSSDKEQQQQQQQAMSGGGGGGGGALFGGMGDAADGDLNAAAAAMGDDAGAAAAAAAENDDNDASPFSQPRLPAASMAANIMQRAKTSARRAAAWLRSPRAAAALPLLVLLVALLALQHAALRRQAAALGAARAELAGHAGAVGALEARLDEVRGRVERGVAEGLARAAAHAAAVEARVGALGDGQRGLEAGLGELRAIAAAVAASGGGNASTAAPGQTQPRPEQQAPAPSPPPADLALAACGGTVAAHSPLALPRLPWAERARHVLRRWGGGGEAAAAPHPSADALLLSPRLLPGRCLPLALHGKGPAFVEVRLPGPAEVASVELHVLLMPPAPGGSDTAEATAAGGWRLPPSAPREVNIQLLNSAAAARVAGDSRTSAVVSIAANVSAPSLIVRAPLASAGPGSGGGAAVAARRAFFEIAVPRSGGGGGGGARPVADGVRLEVRTAQGGGGGSGTGFVCLHRVAVRGAPLGGGDSFC